MDTKMKARNSAAKQSAIRRVTQQPAGLSIEKSIKKQKAERKEEVKAPTPEYCGVSGHKSLFARIDFLESKLELHRVINESQGQICQILTSFFTSSMLEIAKRCFDLG